MKPGQLSLIRRNPALTHAQYLAHFRTPHTLKIIHFLLANHCKTYVQWHGVRASSDPAAPATDIRVGDFDSGGELIFDPPPGAEMSSRDRAYFAQVVVADELTFMAGRALDISRLIDTRCVATEDRRAVIVDGRLTDAVRQELGENVLEQARQRYENWSPEEEQQKQKQTQDWSSHRDNFFDSTKEASR